MCEKQRPPRLSSLFQDKIGWKISWNQRILKINSSTRMKKEMKILREKDRKKSLEATRRTLTKSMLRDNFKVKGKFMKKQDMPNNIIFTQGKNIIFTHDKLISEKSKWSKAIQKQQIHIFLKIKRNCTYTRSTKLNSYHKRHWKKKSLARESW